ncbi:MAG: hypothetical protein AB7G44_12395 [Bacteroidia bacterium]
MKLKLIRSVPESELTILSFHPQSDEYKKVEWKEPHEFRYKGRMYDISHQETDAQGVIHFYCINDTQEEELFADLDEHVQDHISNMGKSEKSSKNIVKKIVDDYFCETAGVHPSPANSEISFPFLFLSVNTISADVLTPPPDLA